MSNIPEELGQRVALAVAQRKVVPEIRQLAQTIARRSICVDGKVGLDDRNLKASVPFTPEQSARIQVATGGNPDLLLSMSKSDLERLGLGDVLNRRKTRLPKVGYPDGFWKNYAFVYLKCDL